MTGNDIATIVCLLLLGIPAGIVGLLMLLIGKQNERGSQTGPGGSSV